MTAKHPKRPRDANQLAKRIVDIATGEVEDREAKTQVHDKDHNAAALGKKGGEARAKKMTAARRKEIARRAAKLRWAARSR